MKSLLVTLWLRSLHDIVRMGSYPGTTRDSLTVESRTEDEGLSFLTITLPSFCTDFERSLSLGHIDPSGFRSFRKRGGIPAFLSGILGRIFSHGGILLEEPDIKAIGHIRQLTLMFKKLEVACSPSREQAALDAYLAVERDLAQLRVKQADLDRFSSIAKLLWCNFEVGSTFELRPKYGPGVTADRLSQSKRRELPIWHERLEPYFPIQGFGTSINAPIESTALVPEELEQPVRVILVPKTLKAPRVIAAEPACMQFCQQSLLDHLNQRIDRYYGNFIGLNDQERNRRLSYNLACATLDLSEASDRVHGALVYLMLSGVPLLRDAAFACRSTKAMLPDGTVVPLQKFASMGSALCFPIETMVFFTIVIMGILGDRPIHHVPRVLKELEGKCSIFGDDIIIPKEYASAIIDELTSFGMKVNRDKSFWTGKFRESCGSDVYDGTDITPLRVRKPMIANDPDAAVSYASLANKFYKRGYIDTAEFIYSYYRKILPYRALDERFAGFDFAGTVKSRFNRALQRREFVTHVAVARTNRYGNDGWSGLSDWFVRSLRSHDTRQGTERSKGVPLKIKRTWTAG